MPMDPDEVLAGLRRAEFVLRLIGQGDQEALSYARSVSSDLRKIIEKSGATPVPGPGLGAAKRSKKASPPPPPPRERREPTYWESVKSMAEDVKENCPDPGDDECRHRYIHESVDGSAWIIYYSENEKVLQETNNEPDPGEVRGMSAPDADWKDMRMIAAYLAMEADVWEELRELDEKAEE